MLSSCYLPRSHARFENEMNSLIGNNIDVYYGSTYITKRTTLGHDMYEFAVTEPSGCQYSIVTDKTGKIKSWKQIGDPCKCMSGGLIGLD